MRKDIVIAGVGGQGNVLASQLLGRVAVKKGFSVTVGETFGLSQRGGPVMSHVRIHDGRVLAPVIFPNSADFIIGLEPLETLRVLPELASPRTVVISNNRPVYPLNVIAGEVEYPDLLWIKESIERNVARLYWINATAKPLELGSPILTNIVMLGAACTLSDFPFKLQEIEDILKVTFKGDKLSQNLIAFWHGASLMEGLEGEL